MNTTKRELFRLMLFIRCTFKEYNNRLIEVRYFKTWLHFHFCCYKSYDYWVDIMVGVKYSTCTWYLYISTYLSVLAVLEYLVYGNIKVLVLVLVLDQKVLGTCK